jgi:hypothetical protein
VDITIRDFNIEAADVSALVAPLFAVRPVNLLLGEVSTVDVSVLSTRATVHVDLISESPMALHVLGTAVATCGDRFTVNDDIHALVFDSVNPTEFGENEEEWYIQRLFREQ